MYFPPTASYIKKQDTTGEVGRKWHPLHWRDYGNKRGCGGGVLWHPPVDSPPNKCASWCRWIIIFQRNLAPNKDLETLSWNEKTRGRQRGDVYRARTWRSSFLTSLKESRGGGGEKHLQMHPGNLRMVKQPVRPIYNFPEFLARQEACFPVFQNHIFFYVVLIWCSVTNLI